MLSKVSSESGVINIHESYTQNFALDNLTIPLARKLAVVVLIDSRPETEQIQGFKTDDANYNSGNIIIEDYKLSPIASRSSSGTQKSGISSHTNFKMPAPGMRSPAESHYHISGHHLWRRFISVFSVIWKNWFGDF